VHLLRHIYLHHVQLQGHPAVQTVRGTAASAGTSSPHHRVDTDSRLAGALIERFITARSAIAPMLAEPNVLSTQISQFLHGHDALVLETSNDWLLVRGADQYEGWVHEAYFNERNGDASGLISGWKSDRPMSLGCVVTETDGQLRKLPLGALLSEGDSVQEGKVVSGEERQALFPCDGSAITETAISYFEGTYYQWGGITPWGCDCSGLAQSCYSLHGVQIRRDAALQATEGREVEGGLEGLRPADLLFFSDREDGYITHVALSRGERKIVHLTLYQGGHALDDLDSSHPRLRKLRSRFRFARRILG
jgi:gamma-D-glutamyl-L-lysine dipeptidyl-peptidase